MTLADLEEAFKAAKKVFFADETDEANKAAFQKAEKAFREATQELAKKRAAEESSIPPRQPKKKKIEKAKSPKKIKKAASPRKPHPPSKRLFLGGLSFGMTEAAIKEFFEDCGKITDCHRLMDKKKRFKGMAFVTFGSLEESAKACAKNGKTVKDRVIRINYAGPRKEPSGGRGPKPVGEKPEGCTTIFVGNLKFSLDEEKIREFFKDCGAISRVRMMRDGPTRKFKGAAFIEFENPEASLDKAVAKNGSTFLGRTINCDYAAPRPEKPEEL